ncbi:MAG: ATP-binding protein [Saprospiraceae bacterium]|nr:ATP-binding protein [Saprospiraceae bacterium]MBP6567300.1 ATP-binding protein [Saprospiraceae bacterium]
MYRLKYFNALMCIVLLLLYIQKVDCQSDSLHFYQLTTANGLPTNKVNCMAQDAFGVLWLGTLNGLVRYSGTKFKVYQYHPLDEKTIPPGEIKQILATDKFKIWGLTSEGNMFLYDYMKPDDKEITRLNNVSGWPNFKIQLFHEVNTRMILIFDDLGKIWLLDKFTLSFQELKISASRLKSKVYSAITNTSGHYFGGKGEIYKISKKLDSLEIIRCPRNDVNAEDLSNFQIDFIQYYSESKFLIGSKDKSPEAAKGLLIFDTKLKKISYLEIDFGTGNSCYLNYDVVKYLGDSTFYIKPIGTTSHFGNIYTNHLTKVKSNEHIMGMLNTGSINNVMKIDDQIFILTNQGLNVSDPKRSSFPHYFVYDKRLMASQMGSFLSEKHKLMCVASRNFLRIIDISTRKTINKIPYPCIHSKHSQQQVEIVPLSNDEILILSSYCYIYSLKDNRFITLEKEEEYNSTMYYDIIAKYNDNNLTIFSRNGELFKFNKSCRNLEKINIIKEGKIIYPKITGITLDHFGNLWLSAEDHGLIKVRLGKYGTVLYHWNPKEYILSDIIFDKHKNMWITSKTHGLLKWNFDTKTPFLYSLSIGLAIYNMDQISEDKFGKFWIQTNQGITKIDPISNVYLNFDKRHGLRYPHNIFRGKTWHPNGNLYVSGGVGIIEINPLKFLDKGDIPNVWISNFETKGIKNLKIWKDTILELEPFQNDILIEFDVVNFNNFKTSIIEYSFGQRTNRWIKIDPQKSALNYYNLSPGEYNLTFRSIYNENIKPKVLKFIIKKPWYQTWYFRSSLIILSFLGIRRYIKLRTQRLLEKQKIAIEKEHAVDAERKRIARDMHDDLGSGLSAIHLYSDYLRSNLAEQYPEISDEIQKIVLSSSELNQKVKEIIWSNENKMQSVSTVFQFLKKSYAELINSNQCNLQIGEISEENDLIMDANTSKNIYLCLKEAINNSIKYAQAKNLHVQFSIENGNSCFTVQDDGIGFSIPDVKLNGGRGLVNIKNRMNELHGSAEFYSSSEGTIVKFILKI